MPTRLPGKTGLSSENNGRLIPEQIWLQQNFTICHGNTFPLDFSSDRDKPSSLGLGSLAKCHPDSLPALRSSKDLVVLLGNQADWKHVQQSRHHTRVYTHTGFFLILPWAASHFSFLCLAPETIQHHCDGEGGFKGAKKGHFIYFFLLKTRQAVSRGGRWVQRQLVYKSTSLQPLCVEADDGPHAWFELVISKHSTMTASFSKETSFTQVFP